ncbi:MAG: transposase, partial [Methylococcaceae bacterium]|nr:transposase [Methylococcaceae bacterium]
MLVENSISMGGRRAKQCGRLWRTVKYEDVSEPGLCLGLTDYFLFYNGERPHQSLGYMTPDVVYRRAIGGGAKV